jgi:hypothetical protein
MKLPEVVILSLAIAFLIIGIHQTILYGFGNAYWAVMLALVLFFVFNLKRARK